MIGIAGFESIRRVVLFGGRLGRHAPSARAQYAGGDQSFGPRTDRAEVGHGGPLSMGDIEYSPPAATPCGHVEKWDPATLQQERSNKNELVTFVFPDGRAWRVLCR